MRHLRSYVQGCRCAHQAPTSPRKQQQRRRAAFRARDRQANARSINVSSQFSWTDAYTLKRIGPPLPLRERGLSPFFLLSRPYQCHLISQSKTWTRPNAWQLLNARLSSKASMVIRQMRTSVIADSDSFRTAGIGQGRKV